MENVGVAAAPPLPMPLHALLDQWREPLVKPPDKQHIAEGATAPTSLGSDCPSPSPSLTTGGVDLPPSRPFPFHHLPAARSIDRHKEKTHAGTSKRGVKFIKVVSDVYHNLKSCKLKTACITSMLYKAL